MLFFHAVAIAILAVTASAMRGRGGSHASYGSGSHAAAKNWPVKVFGENGEVVVRKKVFELANITCKSEGCGRCGCQHGVVIQPDGSLFKTATVAQQEVYDIYRPLLNNKHPLRYTCYTCAPIILKTQPIIRIGKVNEYVAQVCPRELINWAISRYHCPELFNPHEAHDDTCYLCNGKEFIVYRGDKKLHDCRTSEDDEIKDDNRIMDYMFNNPTKNLNPFYHNRTLKNMDAPVCRAIRYKEIDYHMVDGKKVQRIKGSPPEIKKLFTRLKKEIMYYDLKLRNFNKERRRETIARLAPEGTEELTNKKPYKPASPHHRKRGNDQYTTRIVDLPFLKEFGKKIREGQSMHDLVLFDELEMNNETRLRTIQIYTAGKFYYSYKYNNIGKDPTTSKFFGKKLFNIKEMEIIEGLAKKMHEESKLLSRHDELIRLGCEPLTRQEEGVEKEVILSYRIADSEDKEYPDFDEKYSDLPIGAEAAASAEKNNSSASCEVETGLGDKDIPDVPLTATEAYFEDFIRERDEILGMAKGLTRRRLADAENHFN